MPQREKIHISDEYMASIRRRMWLFVLFCLILACLAIFSIALGSFDMSALDVLWALLGKSEGSQAIVVWNIRAPRIMAAIVAGWGLGVSGAVMQCLLRNPLGSPFTLGISHGAAFGAAFAIVVMGAGGAQYGALRTTAAQLLTVYNIYTVTFFAFLGAMITTFIILLLSRMRQMAPESIILAGVALSSLFVSGTILIQYFATEVELASIVFWTFGDVSRSNWNEIGVMTLATFAGTIYFILKQWDFNALSVGEDVAKGLGVEVERTRLWGMFMAALVAALVVAFHGVIAFLGLLAPHIGRRIVGSDHRVLLIHSCVLGSIILLLADTVGRVLVGSGTLPVGVLTSFMGAPLFLYLLIAGRDK
jgi:iron complex transport system permease protein